MAGCFSWCPRRVINKSKTFTRPEISIRASDEGEQATPTTAMYMMNGGKTIASTLESVSGFIPVPFLSEFVKIAINVLQACEDAIAIEEGAKVLQERVANLTLVIINKVPDGGHADEDLRGRIKNLQGVFENINVDLNEIKQQKKWLLVFFRDINKERIDRCVNRVNTALEQFNVSHQLHVEKLLDKIKSKDSNQLDRIEDAVKRTNQPHNAPQTLSRQDMPPAKIIFYGRESVVNDVSSLLFREDTSRVCITGAGGMGKTSVALAIIHSPAMKDIFPNYRFWIPCIEAKSADLLRRILYTQLRITAESYDSLDPLIKELNSSKERRLLLLDNFETPWFAGHSQAEVSAILVRLTELRHIALIVTMTSAFPPPEDSVEWQHCPLLPLDATAARETFKRLCPCAADAPQLDELLEAVGRIPLAITLMAADGTHSQASPEDLLLEWRKAGTEMNSTMDRRIGLSVHGVESNPEAFKLLSILSMLPAGTTGKNLRWWAPTLVSHSAAVAALRTTALIEQLNKTREMVSRNRISAEVQQQVHNACYKFVLERKSIPDDAKFKWDLQELADEETNLQSLLMQISADNIRTNTNALDALLTFSLYQCWTKPSTVAAMHALDLASTVQDSRRVAEAHQCLGRIFFNLDRFEEAGQHFEEARNRFKTLPSGPDCLRAGECSMKLAHVWMWMVNKTEEEINALVLEGQADLSHDTSDKYHVAHGMRGLGHFLWWAGRSDQALDTLFAAKVIFEELECPASTAECLYVMGLCYTNRDEYRKALVVYKEGLAATEETGDIELILRVLERLARSLIVLEFHDEAFTSIERALSIGQALGSPLSIAQDLELLGYNCAATVDLRGAQAAYKGARVQYANIPSTPLGKEGEDRCADNLRKMEDMDIIYEDYFFELEKPDPLY